MPFVRRFWPLALLAVAFVGAVYGEWSSARTPRIYQHSGSQPENNGDTNSKDQANVALIAWARDNHDAIEALSAIGSFVFAIVLGGSTLMLWDATRKSAKAGRDSADIARRALTELEQPFIVFSVKNTGLSVDNLGIVSPIGMLISKFENIGRTAAILVEHCDNVLVVERRKGFPDPIDPASPSFGLAHHTTFPVGFAVGTKGNYEVQENMIRKPMEDPLWYSLADNSGKRDHLFVYGFLRYADIFEGHYIMGYCAVYEVTGNRFVLQGGPKHNYFRKEN